MTIGLVKSADNPADALTRVPKEWLRVQGPEDGPVPSAVAAAANRRPDVGPAQIRAVHEATGHQGVRRTLWYVRRDQDARATRSAVRAVIRQCDVCQSINPAPVRWRHGSLSVPLTWERLAIDVTHYQGRSYLTVITVGRPGTGFGDCCAGLMRLSWWNSWRTSSWSVERRRSWSWTTRQNSGAAV